MTAAAASPGRIAGAAPVMAPVRGSAQAEKLRLALLWLTGASSALVFIEPSPYEIVSFLTVAVFAIGGLTLSTALMPFAILLVLINLGYTISSTALLGEKSILIWLFASWYLALTSVFFAAALSVNTERRIEALLRGCMAAGVIAALAGIAGYFRLVPGGSDLLLLYDRARGTFKDPNVFGAFLILPALLALQMVVVGRFATALRGACLLGLLTVGILLSFSRAAWGLLGFCGALTLALMLLTTRSANQRMRIVLIGVTGIAALSLLLSALMSIDAVAGLLKERMSLEQDYDAGHLGRFGRHALGALLALEVPLGVGPLQFAKIFPEDPHNSYLNAFMSGGWLAGVAYPTLTLLTLTFGFRYLLVRTPWQPAMIAVFAAYTGMAIESFIIDTDHWRHVFLLLGVLWGLIVATRLSRARRDPGPVPAAARPAALAHPHPAS